MITAFTVRNFKAIGEKPVRIEFKPITLLFGPNSAGKSSILHALHYAHEVFINHNLSPERSITGDHSCIDLGGFERFVHDKDLNRIISIRLDFDHDIRDIRDIPESLFITDLFKKSFAFSAESEIEESRTNSYVEIDIAWNKINNKPYVKRYETGFNGERMATINFDIYKKQAILQYLNIDHPIFYPLWEDRSITVGSIIRNTVDKSFYKTNSDLNQECIEVNEIIQQQRKNIMNIISNDQIEIFQWDDEDEVHNKIINNDIAEESHMRSIRKQLFQKYGRIPPCTNIFSGDNNLNIALRQFDALPHEWNQPLRIIDSTWKISTEIESMEDKFFLNDLLTCLIIAPGYFTKNLLLMRYHLGPLREIPPRQFSGTDPYHESNRWRWATGLAAWDLLYWIGKKQLESKIYSIDFSSPLTMEFSVKNNVQNIDIINIASSFRQLDTINDWLSNKNRLNSGYKIVIQHYRELPSNHPLLGVVNEDKHFQKISDLVKDVILIPEKTRIWLQDESQNLLTPDEIGIGISQILPVVVAATGKPWGLSLLVIEQPELHIHPAMQVQLADLFISQAIIKKGSGGMRKILSSRYFLIETHSEHLLLRLLRRINETFEGELPPEIEPCTADDVAIYYLEKGSEGMCVRRLEISEDGDSKGEWPEGFFEERRAELF